MSTVTINSVTYTVYGDDVAAGVYFDARIGGYQWSSYVSPQGSGQTGNDLKRALVTATNMFNAWQQWQGTLTNSTQPLAWPRTGVMVGGIGVDSSSIPAAIIDGNFELALALLLDPDSILGDANGTTMNTRMVKAGSVAVENFKPIAGTRWPTAVYEFVGPYFGGQTIANSTAGDTVSESSFDEESEQFTILRGT